MNIKPDKRPAEFWWKNGVKLNRQGAPEWMVKASYEFAARMETKRG